MLQSRTFTPAFRFFAGLAVFALAAAFVVGFSSADQSPIDRVVGPLTLGWKGGVGNHLAYAFFAGLFAVSAGLAGLLVAFRDADPEAVAEVVRADSVPLTRAPAGANYMPALAGFALVLVMVGLATDRSGFSIGGVVVAVAVAVVWTLRAWADRATGDDTVNAELYHRFIDPLRTPVVALLCIALVVVGLSRLLLAVSKTGSVVAFGGIAAVIFAVAAALALRPRLGRHVVTVLVIVGAIAILAAGIIGAAAGERNIEHEEDHSGQEAPAGGAEGSALAVVVITTTASVETA